MADRVVSVKVNADVTGAVSGLRKVKASVDDLTKADVKKPKKAFEDISNKAALMGGVVALGIGKAISSFADFDAAMSAASAATGAAGAEMEQLRALAIKAGQDTQFSATEAAQGITEMAKAGVDASDIMGGGLKGALDLAAAGQLDVGRSAEIAATALNQFQLKGKDLPHVADLFAAAAGKAQGSVEDIANAMKFVGPVAQSMNISIEEATGVIGEFASQGIVGEQAGTSFRGMLLSLTSPSKIAAGTMQDLGIEIYNADGSMKSMSDIAQVLHDKLGPLDEATRNQALGQIFGNEQLTAATILYKGGGAAVQDWTKKVNDAGFAQKQAAALTDNLKGDIERLGGSIETAFIENGSAANGALRTLTQGLGGLVDVIGKIPAPITLAVTALAGIALTLPKGLSVYKNFTTSLDTLGISMDKIAAKAPRTAKGLSLMGKAAAGLGFAAAGVYAFAGAADSLNVDKLSGDLVGASDGLALINKELAASTSNGWGRVGSDIDSFGKILGATFDPGVINHIDDAIGSFKTIFGGDNVSNIQNAAKQLNGIDQALASLVSGGNGDEAARIFEQMTAVAKDQGIPVDELTKKFPQYEAAVSNTAKAATAAAPAVDALTQATKVSAEEAEAAAKHHSDNVKTILDSFAQIGGATDELTAKVQEKAQAQADATKDPKDSWADYADTVKLSAKDVVKVLDEQTKAAETWRKNLLEVQKRGDEDFLAWVSQQPPQVAQAYAKGTEAQRGKIYAAWKRNVGAQQAAGLLDGFNAGKPAIVDAAAKMHAAAQKALAVKIKIPTTLSPPAKAAVTSVISAVQRAIGVLAVPVKPVIGQTYIPNPYAAKVVKAAGGPVFGPGTGTSDSIPAMLSNGEHVLTAAEVRAAGGHAAILALRKAMLTGGVQFRAQGGPISAPVSAYRAAPVSVSLSGRTPSAAEIGAAVAQHMPPMIGAVYGGPDTLTAVRQGIREWEWRVAQ